MDIKTLAVAEATLRAEGNRCIKVADEIAALIRHYSVEASPTPKTPQTAPLELSAESSGADGFIAVAVDVLREQGRQMHITELTQYVGRKLGRPVTREQIESAVARALKTPKWMPVITRAARATYALLDSPQQH